MAREISRRFPPNSIRFLWNRGEGHLLRRTEEAESTRSGSSPDANLRRHSAWLSFKPLNGRKTFLPYCIKAVINSLAIVMHLNEAESWPRNFFHPLSSTTHFSSGYANRVNGRNFVEDSKDAALDWLEWRILMHKIFFARMNEMEEKMERGREKKKEMAGEIYRYRYSVIPWNSVYQVYA